MCRTKVVPFLLRILCSYRSNGISYADTAAHFFVVYMAGFFEQQEYIWSSILACFFLSPPYSQRSHVLLFLPTTLL